MNARFLLSCSLAALLSVAGHAESLWRDGAATSIVADRKAHAVGDLLTIVVQESSTAKKDNNTKTAKETEIDASLQTFLYGGWLAHRGQMPAVQASAKTGFNGGGTINNSEQIIARITVQVIDVLPNRNLVIEGRRQTAFSGETQEIVLRGIVRPEDVNANNSIFSYNIADATIQFVNKGSVSDTQRKGWFTKLWDFVTPF